MKAVVTELIRATPDVVLLRIKPERYFEFRPGQFIQVLVEKGGRTIKKSYSVASPPSVREYVELCIKVVKGGYASNHLAGLKPGQQLQVEGPFGRFILQEEINNDLVFMATGAGIAPFKPMIQEVLARTSRGVWLFFGVRTEKDIIYRDFFDALAAANSDFHFVPVLSDESKPGFEHGFVQDVFKRLFKQNNQDIYICGVYEMVDNVKQMCRELGYPAEKIHYEKYI
jgi:ferredoxin-NADP reductase